jgi:hypothetical protein
LHDSSNLSCFIERELFDFEAAAKSLDLQDTAQNSSVDKVVKQVSETAEGLAYFAISLQFDFDYLVG